MVFLHFYKDCTGSIREAFNLAFDEGENKIRLLRILEFYNITIMITWRNNFLKKDMIGRNKQTKFKMKEMKEVPETE